MPLECNDQISRIIFAGPSLLQDVFAELPFDTELLPPIQRGDLDRAEKCFPNLTSIGIIDGRLFNSFTVSPKEILTAMDRGKRVFGSSAVGALRAAELNVYGMSGIGSIFHMFSSGELEADDEVLMNYDTESFVRTSQPMVDIRLTLQRACQSGRISAKSFQIAVREARSLYYPERTYDELLCRLRGQLADEELGHLAICFHNSASATNQDAQELLLAMGISSSAGSDPEQSVPVSPIEEAVRKPVANRRHWPAIAAGGHPPALRKVSLPGVSNVLPKPVSSLPGALGDVLANRRSVRTYADRPLDLTELSALLFHSARVVSLVNDPVMGDVALRPFPTAGARSELEIYFVGENVSGIEAGAYYYDPFDHAICRLRKRDEQHKRILASAHVMTGQQLNRKPSVVLLITAVFERIMWKYGELGPSLIYKDVGCLIQTLYLVATSLGLAPCALGGGEEAQWSRWLGLNPQVESQVGCMIIGPAAATS